MNLTKDQIRFAKYVDRSGDCWLWTGAKNPTGYGVFRAQRIRSTAHRFAWEWERGPIPQGMEIHHRCHTPSCVKPAHLEVVTHRKNLQNRRFPTWGELDGHVDEPDAEPVVVRLSPVHSAWVRARAEETGTSVEDVVERAVYRYMARILRDPLSPSRK